MHSWRESSHSKPFSQQPPKKHKKHDRNSKSKVCSTRTARITNMCFAAGQEFLHRPLSSRAELKQSEDGSWGRCSHAPSVALDFSITCVKACCESSRAQCTILSCFRSSAKSGDSQVLGIQRNHSQVLTAPGVASHAPGVASHAWKPCFSTISTGAARFRIDGRRAKVGSECLFCLEMCS